MNLSVHFISGGVLAAVIFIFFGFEFSIGFFCFASFLDVDHYIYYVLKFRELHIRNALEYFNSHRHVERFCLCIFHTVEVFIAFSLITYFSNSPFVYASFMGFLFHYLIDIAQGLYYKRLHYRWWSALGYYQFINKNNVKQT